MAVFKAEIPPYRELLVRRLAADEDVNWNANRT
jgi:hypothetical protein